MVICLERGADLHMAQLMPLPLSLAPVKSRLVLPFWYRLTWVVPDKGPLHGCVCVCVFLLELIMLHIIESFTVLVTVWESMYQSPCLFIYMCVYLSVCIAGVSFTPFITCMAVCLSVCVCVCMPLCLFTCIAGTTITE